MVQGTGSSVGKSVLVVALCRILRQAGYAVAPFKAQNMALNSFITRDGKEMARSQAVQARAAGIEPDVDMNPVLLKPTEDALSQVIVQGRAVGNMSARGYHGDYVQKVWPAIVDSFERLQQQYEIIVLEGAGSPAEVNLQERDVVNMRAARLAEAPVLLVTDIDRGGALAAVVGTLELLPPEDRKRVAGVVINKFRGDRALLQPALDFLEKKTGVMVVGVIPYFNLKIPEEDSVNLGMRLPRRSEQELEIAVLYLPHISNFTDFDPLEAESDVYLRYVYPGEKIGKADLVIIPGSKNTIGDLGVLRRNGWDKEILSLAANGVPVMGICGGFQMLGRKIFDPQGVESSQREAEGLSLLNTITVFRNSKSTVQAAGLILAGGKFWNELRGYQVSGYEIHMGETFREAGAFPLLSLKRKEKSSAAGETVTREAVRTNDKLASGKEVLITLDARKAYEEENLDTHKEENLDRGKEILDGAVSENGLVFGTYLHGIFDSDCFRRAFLNQLRQRKGLPPLALQSSFWAEQEKAFDELAEVVRKNLDMAYIYRLLGISGS